MKTKVWVGLFESFKEYFLILTPLGILVFKEAGSTKSEIIPLNSDAKLT